MDEFRLLHLAGEIRKLVENGVSPVLVISGAVYYGFRQLGWKEREIDRSRRQVLAGVGQACLTAKLVDIFRKKEMKIAQILLTKDDLQNKKISEELKKMFNTYQNLGIIPVLNENDAVELNSFGGNDLLAGMVVELVRSKSLMMLSTWEGSVFGVGGKATKDEVMGKLNVRGIRMEILNGKVKNVLTKKLL